MRVRVCILRLSIVGIIIGILKIYLGMFNIIISSVL